jgi:hypothetical protein
MLSGSTETTYFFMFGLFNTYITQMYLNKYMLVLEKKKNKRASVHTRSRLGALGRPRLLFASPACSTRESADVSPSPLARCIKLR